MAAMRARRLTGRDSERGAELVEFAVVLPLLLLVVVGIVDFGTLFRDYEIITNAAREGARLASLADNYNQDDVKLRVRLYAEDAGLVGAQVNSDVTPTVIPLGATSLAGRRVTVTYDHEFTFLGPIANFFGSTFGTVTLTAQSTMRNEAPVGP